MGIRRVKSTNATSSVLALAFLGSFSLGTAAATELAGPACTAPSKPSSLKTQEEVNAFAREMETYQRCIMAYVDEHQKLSKAHGDAANAAVEAWNKYVADMNKKPTS